MPISVSVVSADREVYAGEARLVSAKTVEGQIGLLAGHQPVLAVLGEGEVAITLESGERIVIDAADGFLSFEHDTATIIAAKAALV